MPSPESRQIRATLVRNPDAPSVSLEEGRRQWEAAALAAPLPLNTTITPVLADGVPCEWVRCGKTADTQVLLFLHGGGFNAGSCVTHRELAARLSLAGGMYVLLVDYALAPEHPFPAGLEQCIRVYQWLLEQGYTSGQIAIGGDSAGGGLAMSVLVSLGDQHVPLPAAAVLLSPWLDLAFTGETIHTRAYLDPMTMLEGLQQAAHLYIGDRDPTDPLISPLYTDLHGLPPLLIHVGDHEILLSDSVRLTQRAQVAGVDVSLTIWEEMWHVFPAFAASLPEGQQAIDGTGAWLRQQMRR